MIIPETHHQDHAIGKCGADTLEASVLAEDVFIAKSSLLGGAKLRCDFIATHTTDGGLRLGDDFAVLYIETFDRAQSARGGAIICDEL